MTITVISERKYKAGYVVKNQQHSDFDVTYKTAYTPEGHYIGNPKDAYHLCKKRGIKPELRTPSSNVCSIGFCEREQKWYGWSHRAMFGFGVGSKVKAGDCGYVPTDLEDAKRDAIRFWSGDEHHYDTHIKSTEVDESGRTFFNVAWTYTEGVPNEKLRGTQGGSTHYAPEVFGCGEWTAKSMEDAKQMAIDFAEGVG